MMASQFLGLSSAFLFTLSRPFRRFRRWHRNAAQSPSLIRAVIETLDQRRLLSASIVSNVLVENGSGGGPIIVYQLPTTPVNEVYISDAGGTSGPFDVDTFDHIKINGSTGADLIIVRDHTNNAPQTGETYVTKRCEIHGDAGDDTIYGGDLADTIFGDLNSDTIYGGEGDDVLYGGYGYGSGLSDNNDDHVYGDSGYDVMYGDEGKDTLDDEDSTCYGIFYGGDGGDTCTGGSQNDTMIGGAGADYLDGRGGNDSLLGQGDADSIYGGDGDDYIDGGDGDDAVLEGDAGHDTLNGGAGNDSFFNTDTVSDTLDGGSGDDTLFNHDGADQVVNIEHIS